MIGQCTTVTRVHTIAVLLDGVTSGAKETGRFTPQSLPPQSLPPPSSCFLGITRNRGANHAPKQGNFSPCKLWCPTFQK